MPTRGQWHDGEAEVGAQDAKGVAAEGCVYISSVFAFYNSFS